MIKKTLLYAIVFLFGITTISFAEEVVTLNSIDAVPTEVTQEKLEEKKVEMEQKREAVEIKMKETRRMHKEQLEEKKLQAQERLEEKKVEMEQKRQEIRSRLTEGRRRVVEAYSGRMVKRLKAAVSRLSRLAERIGSRIDKLSEKFETETALALVAEAKTKIEVLIVDIDGILTIIKDSFNAEDPKTSFENSRELIKEIASEIKEAHKMLVDAIKSLKAQIPEKTSDTENTPEKTESENTEESE